jgi:hypothetical protein
LQKKILDKHRDIESEFWGCRMDEYDEYYTIHLEEQGFINPKIRYDLSCCQGSGASFTCDSVDIDVVLKDVEIPHKQTLIDILKEYCEVKVEKDVNCRYTHEYSCGVTFNYPSNKDLPLLDKAIDKVIDIIEEKRLEACSTLYEQLEKDYEYLESDECIRETLIANEYYFDENGNIDTPND